MTSLIAWLAVDQRRPSAIYFASDSRQSWLDGGNQDNCIKLFVPVGSTELFGFAGDVDFPSMILAKLTRAIEGGSIPPGCALSLYGRVEWVFEFIRAELLALPSPPKYSFTILHASRNFFGMGAKFALFAYTYLKKNENFTSEEIIFPIDQSGKLKTDGTGKYYVDSEVTSWEASWGKVSRTYFSAFCKSVQQKDDPQSGGPIQLVGLGSAGPAKHVGVIAEGGTFYRGSTNLVALPADVQWRNTKFERVDQSGVLLPKAQRHG